MLYLAIVLCCLFRCRIPRTKQEIEADFLRKRITESFRSHLEKIKIDELQGQYDTGNLLPRKLIIFFLLFGYFTYMVFCDSSFQKSRTI